MQHEITHPVPLLDGRGNLTEPGWARSLLPVYDRTRVRGGATRLKEWDYYLVMGEGFALALTIADNSYMGLDSVSLLDFRAGTQVTRSPMRLLPMGRTGLPSTSAQGDVASSGRGYGLCFLNDGETRTLLAHVDDFSDGRPLDAQVTLRDGPAESIVVCTPFPKDGHFYYNQKINCLRADGAVTLGDSRYLFHPETSFGTLDWGRGVWTYRNTWYWGSASGLLDGVPFGFNIGCGFGDTTAGTENALFYDGRLHKLGRVSFQIPRQGWRDDFLSVWTMTSDDGRFEMAFRPVLDRAARTSAVVIQSDQHQVFGYFTGRVTLDDGSVRPVHNLMGFAEKVANRW